MNIYLSGQRTFGRLVLEMLLRDGHNVLGVSAPAPVNGRMDKLWSLADLRGLRLLPAGQLKAATLPNGVDLIIAAHSHDFISAKTRNKAQWGAVGYHPSLLPLHRGRDAVRWAVKMGDKVAGGSVYWLTDNVDAGPVAAQDWCFIRPGWTAQQLWHKELQPMGVRLLRRVLRDVGNGYFVRIEQDEALATWEPALDQPPLFRHDLLQIGTMTGGRVIVDRETLWEREAGQTAADRFLAWLEGDGGQWATMTGQTPVLVDGAS